jgi:hypothetical protein
VVNCGDVMVTCIPSKENLVDIMMKSLAKIDYFRIVYALNLNWKMSDTRGSVE